MSNYSPQLVEFILHQLNHPYQAPFQAEVEINHYSQHARWKVTHKGALDSITQETECVVTTKGAYVEPGRQPQPGERKLHLLIQGPTEMGVELCRMEIIRRLEED